MATPFASLLRGLNAAQEDQRRRKLEDAEAKERASLNKIRLDAAAAAASDRENTLRLQASQRAARIAGLRRLGIPGYENATDDELAGVPEEVFRSALLEKLKPKQRTPVPVTIAGKRQFAWRDAEGNFTDAQGNPLPDVAPDIPPNQLKPETPKPPESRATDRGIEEWDPATQQWKVTGRQPYRAPQRPTSGGMTASNQLTLRGQFNGEPTVKNAAEVATALRKVRASATDPSAAGDMSLLIGYMKLLDPGSVVREQEFATAAKSGSLPQQIQAAAAKVVNGQRLTPEQRADFVARSEAVAKAYHDQFQSLSSRYSADATAAGLDPARIIYDPFGGVFDTAAGGGTEEQKLWDAAVKIHGKAKVEQMYGPRPK